MHYISIKILSLFILGLSFTDINKNIPVKDDPAAEVKKSLDGQVAAWNAGQLEKAMAFYWNSPELLWVGKSGIQKGYQPVLESFKQEYTDKSKMGIYSYDSLYIEQISPTAVYFVIRWKITLNDKKIMGGVSSQVWKKIGDGWVITVEHAS